MARLTDKTLAQSTAITPTTLIHIVYTGDPSQNAAGSSYKAELQQLYPIFGASTFTGGTVVGQTTFTNGLSANTITASTIDLCATNGTLFTDSISGCSPINFLSESLFQSGLSGTSISGLTLNLSQIPIISSGNTLSIDSNGNVVITTGSTRSENFVADSSFESKGPATFQDNVQFYQGLRSTKIRSFSPLAINDGNEGNVHFGSSSGVTVDVTNSRIGIGTLNPTKDLEVTGSTLIGGGLTASTISATTYQNLPTSVDTFTTGFTYSNNEFTLSRNQGQPNLTATINTVTGLTVSGTITTTTIGVGTSSPSYPLDVRGVSGLLNYDPTSAGGRLVISGNTNIPRMDVTIPAYLTKPVAGSSIGIRTWDDATYPGYGKVGDTFLRAGNESNGLNIINSNGTGTEDYIRFYAGKNADTLSDLHIQGSGATMGYIGINIENPTERLHVSGNTLVSGNISANTLTLSGVSVNPKQTIALFFGHDSLSPGDTQTYYIGNSINLTAPISGSDGRRVIMPKTGNIVRVGICQTVGGTLGTSETSTFTVNNVTQVTQSTITTTYTYDASSANISYNLATPLAVTEGDKIELRWTTPTWVTNPTTVRQQMNVYLEY